MAAATVWVAGDRARVGALNRPDDRMPWCSCNEEEGKRDVRRGG